MAASNQRLNRVWRLQTRRVTNRCDAGVPTDSPSLDTLSWGHPLTLKSASQARKMSAVTVGAVPLGDNAFEAADAAFSIIWRRTEASKANRTDAIAARCTSRRPPQCAEIGVPFSASSGGDEVELTSSPGACSQMSFSSSVSSRAGLAFHGWLDHARRSDRWSESNEGIGRRTVPDLAKDGPLSGMNELREIRHEPNGLTMHGMFIITNAFIIVN